MPARRLCRTLCLPMFVLFNTLTPAHGQTPTVLPVEQFFQTSSFSGATLSPNGRMVAMQISDKNGGVMLVVAPVETMKPKILVKADSDVDRFQWVNDRRLVFSFSDRSVEPGKTEQAAGLFAINVDGSDLRELASRWSANEPLMTSIVPVLAPSTTLLGVGDQKSDTVFVHQYKLANNKELTVDLLRLNTVNGRNTIVGRPGRTSGWLLDQTGEPRIATAIEGNASATYYRDPASDAWVKLFAFEGGAADRIDARGFGADGTLYVVARNGKDKQALYTYDLKAKRLSAEPVVAMADYDFNGSLVQGKDKTAGVRFETDAPATLWFDAKMQAAQKAIDTALPATSNQVSFGRRSETPYVLVHATSDIEPGATYLYNTDSAKLTPLGIAQPGINSKQMADKEMVRYPARDGLVIPAYLTLPNVATKKNLPMVVLVHGGPWLRGGHWDWSREAQFLASRGYIVLEPEYRGSAGFGNKLLTSGFKQWGLAIQNDLADGARWAVKQGLADPKRICIAGSDFGGYAALTALATDGDLFRCAVDIAGVADLGALYDLRWNEANNSVKVYGLTQMLGDQKLDAEQLKAAAPAANAARIKQPVLLAHGGADHMVPIIQGTTLRDALQAANAPVEWISYPEEGNGWKLLKNNVDFWTRVEQFLDKNIGPGAAK